MEPARRERWKRLSASLVIVGSVWLILAGIVVLHGAARPQTARGWTLLLLLAPLALIPYAFAELAGSWVLSLGRARGLARRSRTIRILLGLAAGALWLGLTILVVAALYWSWLRSGVR